MYNTETVENTHCAYCAVTNVVMATESPVSLQLMGVSINIELCNVCDVQVFAAVSVCQSVCVCV